MPATRFIAILLGCLAATTFARAQDAELTAIERYEIPDLAFPVSTLDSDDWLSSIDDLEFQDNSALAKLKRMRDLPLLTITDTSESRLFLGVNSDGLIGLHFTTK